MLYYENKLREAGYKIIIGVDEAGRGPLAGPVVAAAAVLESAGFRNRIDDSKKLTPCQRENAFGEIIYKSVFGIGIISEKVIDRLNILVATRLAMEEAINTVLEKLKNYPPPLCHILVDGQVKINTALPFTNIINGDAKSKSIASASILAKVTRDRIMNLYDRIYPEYGFLRHKGYPTAAHRMSLRKFGPSRIHRVSFCGVC